MNTLGYWCVVWPIRGFGCIATFVLIGAQEASLHGSSVLYNSGTFYLWPIVAVAALQRRPIVAEAA